MQYYILKLSIFIFLLVINLFITILIVHNYIPDPQTHYFQKYLWQIVIYLMFYFLFRLITHRMVMSNEAIKIEKANLFALIAIALILFFSKVSEEYSRSIILLFFILNLLIPICTYFLKRYFMKFKIFRKDIFAVCDKFGEKEIDKWFVHDNSFGFDVHKKIIVDGLSIKEIKKSIDEFSNPKTYHAAVVSLGEFSTDVTFHIVNHIQHHTSRVFVLPKITNMPLFNAEVFNSINHKGLAIYIKNNLLNTTEKIIKQIFDKIMSIVLAIILLPLLLVLYIITYISTKGHPIFKQKRVGQNGKSFRIYKFRTMRIDADEVLENLIANDEALKKEWESEFKLKDDPRVTPIGKFLRRTSLDELPQIINVFQGKMSLVGPRPIIEEEMQMYGEFIDYFKAVKPGMTGLWQVSGRNDLAYDERVQLDVWYVRNWSMELDIIILVKTIAIMISRKGSY